jgi:hypothetical protein
VLLPVDRCGGQELVGGPRVVGRDDPPLRAPVGQLRGEGRHVQVERAPLQPERP